MQDVPVVGGKNASLGEMISNLAGAGISVPGGFATTAQAFVDFLDHNNLTDTINCRLADFDVENVSALERIGKEIRQLVLDAPFQPGFEDAVRCLLYTSPSPRDS